MQNSRLWFSTTLVSISWFGFGLLHRGGLPWSSHAHQIEVRTVPPGAEVLIDGKPVGLSDSYLDLPPGPPPGTSRSQIEVHVKKQGYEDALMRLDAGTSEMPLVSFILKPIGSELRLEGEPGKEVEVWVGPGVPVKLPSASSWILEPGLYEIWGVKAGRTSERRVLRLKPGQVQTLILSWNQGARPSPEVQSP